MERRRIVLLAIIVAAVAVRLYHLDAPLVGTHSWRQADTAAIARNYFRNGYRFASPQVDWGGDCAGYVEMELPVYSYAVALGYGALGSVQEWVGRLLAVAGVVVTLLSLHRLVEATVDPATALWSCAVYALLPMNILFGRAFMPESWMLAASTAGVWFFYRWTGSQRASHLVLSGVLVALAALLKLPSLYLGLPLLWLALARFGPRGLLRWELWLYALGIVAALAAWYLHARHLRDLCGLSFGIWEVGGKWANWDLLCSGDFYYRLAVKSLTEKHLVWLGMPLLLVGLALRRRRRSERLFDAWMIGVIVFFLIAARGNYVHEYYQLPFLLPASVYIGKVFARGIERRPTLLRAVALALAAISLGRYARLTRLEDPERSADWAAAQVIADQSEPDELVIAADSGNPTWLYLADRRGWSRSPAALKQRHLRRLVEDGAACLVGERKHFEKSRLAALVASFELRYDRDGIFALRLADVAGSNVSTFDAYSSFTHPTSSTAYPSSSKYSTRTLTVWGSSATRKR